MILTLGVVLGALVGEASVPKSAEVGAGVLQAAVAGTFARLLSTRPTIPQTSNLARRWGALGVLAGLALVVALTRAHPISRHCSEELRAAETFLRLALESAPALLVAFAGVGLLSFVGATPLAWMGRGGPLSQATRGALVGLPIPVCSCGVLPVYRSLARRGVPLAAALAFLVATPELGIDSVLLSWSLLGPELTIARVVLAAFVAITVAVLTSHGASPPEDLGALDAAEVAPARPMRERWLSTIDEHARHVIPWVVVGLVTAALIEPLVHDAALTQIPPWAQVPAGALLGLPLYVCASGSTPLAAVLMHKGLSAGAALALLLTGPATNLTTFGLLRALHGPRVAVRFAISMFVLATIGGWTVDLFFSPDVVALAHPDPRTSASSVAWASLVVLGAWTLRTLWLAGPRGFLGGLRLHDHGPSASRMSRGSPKFVKVPGRSKLARVPGASHVHDESCGCH
ncbi:permease [Myxococcota bacterium]|nr:permease [Myxococcota bacterium]